MHHDEDAEVYINGVLAASVPGFITDYEKVEINLPAKATLKPAGNVMAVHCHQTTGGQYIDVGIVKVEPPQVVGGLKLLILLLCAAALAGAARERRTPAPSATLGPRVTALQTIRRPSRRRSTLWATRAVESCMPRAAITSLLGISTCRTR